MKKAVLIIFLTFYSLLFSFAGVKTEKRTTESFDEISLRIDANLHFEQGEEQSIVIKGDDKTLDRLIVEVVKHKLIIRFRIEDRWFNDFEPGEVELHIVAPEIEKMSVSGSGNIYVEKTIKGHALELNVAGSGDVKLSDVQYDRVEAKITGSGDVVLSGTEPIGEIRINITGSGDVVAYQLEAKAAYIRIAGSGDCSVFATSLLDVKVMGSGDITYKGDPIVKSGISGSGKIFNR